ncbi:MAG: DNA-directed RNA polymerases I and III subunit RPAC1 [Icmadophila ericetorum]|nr:DNA-directed RNA polymerases I and III subunit RPAC1 [Icmadophila ericetorum]
MAPKKGKKIITEVTPSQDEIDRRKARSFIWFIFVPSSLILDSHRPGETALNTWSKAGFEKSFRVQFHLNEPLDSSFSLIGIDASIANAFRRILIAEIPTIAIENVFVHNNTSIIQDEVLAHRLGLVPLTGNPDGFKWINWIDKSDSSQGPADYNTIVMKLSVECTWKEGVNKKTPGNDPEKLYNNSSVYAKQIVWDPVGRQVDRFPKPDGVVRAANPDILLAKMRPGQAIELEMHCIKGIGADHAKFSPVATASYRLLPTIDIVKPIIGKEARKFARCFPLGVIRLEKITEEEAQKEGSGYEGNAGEWKPVVQNTLKDTVSRECLRHDEFKDKVKLGRVRDHFIFSVESTGQFNSDTLFLESVALLRLKCVNFKKDLQSIIR